MPGKKKISRERIIAKSVSLANLKSLHERCVSRSMSLQKKIRGMREKLRASAPASDAFRRRQMQRSIERLEAEASRVSLRADVSGNVMSSAFKRDIPGSQSGVAFQRRYERAKCRKRLQDEKRAAGGGARRGAKDSVSDSDDSPSAENYPRLRQPVRTTSSAHSSSAPAADCDSFCRKCDSGTFAYVNEHCEKLCTRCGHSEPYLDITMASISFADTREYKMYQYKRLNHFLDYLTQLQGRQATRVPAAIVDAVALDLRDKNPNPVRTRLTDTKRSLKRMKKIRWYDYAVQIYNRVFGKAPVYYSLRDLRTLKVTFRRVQQHFFELAPSSRKNFFSYSYIAYKLTALIDPSHPILPYIQLLKGGEKIRAQEAIFAKIASRIGWRFQPIDVAAGPAFQPKK